MQKFYNVTLKCGKERVLSRDEPDGRSVIGLWKWSMNQRNAVIIDFNEASVNAEYIAMIDNGANLEDVWTPSMGVDRETE